MPQPLRLAFCGLVCSIRAQKRPSPVTRTGDIFICGPFSSSSGMGNGARLYARNMEKQGKQYHCIDITSAMCMKRDLAADRETLGIAETARMTGNGIVVIHANPPQFQLALAALGKKFLDGKCVVAYWSWELNTLPGIWRQALDYVDMVEAPSTFTCDTLRNYTAKPVSLVPHKLPTPKKVKKEYAPDGLLRCLYIFDAGSSLERKNPLGVLKAFRKAFPDGEGRLTIKVNNPAPDNPEYKKFIHECERTPNTSLVKKILSPEEMEDLYLANDVYVSLHRSEGFGLTILEALRHGLYAVATGWSGNMDFMNDPLAYAVPFKLEPVRINHGAYKGLNAHWAEPDVQMAAEILCSIHKRVCALPPQSFSAA